MRKPRSSKSKSTRRAPGERARRSVECPIPVEAGDVGAGSRPKERVSVWLGSRELADLDAIRARTLAPSRADALRYLLCVYGPVAGLGDWAQKRRRR